MLHFRPILSREGISEQQWRVLRTLSEVECLDAAGLARQSQVLAPSLTRMLRGLDKLGLIERTKSADDKRRQNIRLSASGYALVKRLSPDIAAIYKKLEAHIGNDLLHTLYQQVDSMLERLDTFKP